MKKSEFERIIDKVFLGFGGRYGFRGGETKFAPDGCTVSFRNDTTEVELNYRIGEEPWFSIKDVSNPENSSTLEWLLVELGVEKAPTPEQAFRPTPFNEANMESVLVRKRNLLLEHAADFLRGDFSLMPMLKRRASKYEQECRRYIALHTHK
jgi:hypothetical protein